MEPIILEQKINKNLDRFTSDKSNMVDYYNKELRGQAKGTQLSHLISICKLFETEEQRGKGKSSQNKDYSLEMNDVVKLTKDDIREFLRGKWWTNLSRSTQSGHLYRIKNYLKYSNREELAELFPAKIRSKSKQLSKTDLITREDLKLILKNCGIKIRTLIMVMYEGALRKDEALSIKRRDVKFNGGYIILKVSVSKTIERDVPLIESIPYLREYLEENDFKPDEKIFYYKNDISLNTYFDYLANKLAKKYPKEWRKGKRIYPHLFRHSRLTELARTKLNQPQIGKFAGWKANSNMAKVYFHLDDSDIINIMTNEAVEIPKPEPKKPKMCHICNTENNEENLFCWKCGNVFRGEDKEAMAVELISQPYEVEALKEENEKLREDIDKLFTIVKRSFIKDTPTEQPEILEGNITNIKPVKAKPISAKKLKKQ